MKASEQDDVGRVFHFVTRHGFVDNWRHVQWKRPFKDGRKIKGGYYCNKDRIFEVRDLQAKQGQFVSGCEHERQKFDL